MIKIKIRNNSERKENIFDEATTTPRMAFDALGMSYAVGAVFMDGSPLAGAAMDTPMSQLTSNSEVLLSCVVKADGAC